MNLPRVTSGSCSTNACNRVSANQKYGSWRAIGWRNESISLFTSPSVKSGLLFRGKARRLDTCLKCHLNRCVKLLAKLIWPTGRILKRRFILLGQARSRTRNISGFARLQKSSFHHDLLNSVRICCVSLDFV